MSSQVERTEKNIESFAQWLGQPVTREMFGFKPAVPKPAAPRAEDDSPETVERRLQARRRRRSLERVFNLIFGAVGSVVVFVVTVVVWSAMFLVPLYGLIRFVKWAWE